MSIDRLDIAYLAIGAHAALRELPHDDAQRLIDTCCGQLGVIGEVLDFAATLDELYHSEFEGFNGVWAYEVAEPLGGEVVRLMARNGGHASAEAVRRIARGLAGAG